MKGILLERNDLIIQPTRGADGKIISGLVLGDTTYQRCALILESQKGDVKERPTLGFGIDKYMKTPTTNMTRFVTDMKVELKSDGLDAKITVAPDFSTFDIDIQ